MIEFFKEMTVKNCWLWFHILGGGILAKIFEAYINYPTVLLVLYTAFAWEIFELFYDDNPKKTYGSIKNWIADSTGDILGAVLMAWIVVL